MVAHYSGQHVKLAVDAQACAGPVGRAVEGVLSVGSNEDGSNVEAQQCYTYGTSEVGRCRLTLSKPVLKASLVSALETEM
jgi:hypothetical protein